MDIKNFLNEVCKQIKYEPVKEGITQELEAHIKELKEELILEGLEEEKAEEKAVLQMGDATVIGKKLNKIHRPKLDWKILILLIILIGFGIFISILKQLSIQNGRLSRVVIYTLVGVVLSIAIYFIDYKKIQKHSYVLYIIATIIMVYSLILGTKVNGVKYFSAFGFSFSPCTVAVPLYIIAFVGFIVNFNKEKKLTINLGSEDNYIIYIDSIKIILLTLLSLILTLAIPSMANAIILVSIYLIIGTIKIIKTENKKITKLLKIYIPLFTIGLILIAQAPYRYLDRIIVAFNPELDPYGSGYIGMLQKEILENAKVFGEADTPVITTTDYLIPQSENCTFIYLLGKTGIVVSTILILTIILISIKLIINAKNIKDMYGKFVILAVGLLFILQSIAHVLMNINLGIHLNINLPFVSYGGCGFIMSCLTFAIVLSIYRTKDILYNKNV